MVKSKRFHEKRKDLSEIDKLQIEIDGKVKEITRKIDKKENKGKKKFNLGFMDKKKLEHEATKSFLITMKFANGTEKTWVISTSKSTFHVKKMTYYLYYEEAYFDLSMNQFHLYYHEKYAVPINREVIQDGDDAFFSVTPENLKDLIAMNYVSAIVKTPTNKGMLIFILIAVGVVLVVAFLFLKGQGA